METTKEKRKHIRMELLNETCEWRLADALDDHQSKLVDISSSGCFIHSTASIPMHSYILIHFQLPGDLGLLPIYGKIQWQRWAVRKTDVKRVVGFGVEFTDVGPHYQKILDSYVTYLRNKQIIAVSKRLIEEFFGPTVRR